MLVIVDSRRLPRREFAHALNAVRGRQAMRTPLKQRPETVPKTIAYITQAVRSFWHWTVFPVKLATCDRSSRFKTVSLDIKNVYAPAKGQHVPSCIFVVATDWALYIDRQTYALALKTPVRCYFVSTSAFSGCNVIYNFRLIYYVRNAFRRHGLYCD